MALLEPQVTWIHGVNAKDNEVTSFNFGVVKADEDSNVEKFFLWNNYGGTENAPKMEDITITTRDLDGGDGGSVGKIVEAVRDNWMRVRVDSKGEGSFTAIGRGGVGTPNPTGVHAVGTDGETKHVKADSAIAWTGGQTWSLGTFVKPTAPNGFIYEVTEAGLGDGVEPTWLTEEGLMVTDGLATLTARKIMNKPGTNELLGLANNAQNDGTGVADAAGNFAELSLMVSVPSLATTGRNLGNIVAVYLFV